MHGPENRTRAIGASKINVGVVLDPDRNADHGWFAQFNP